VANYWDPLQHSNIEEEEEGCQGIRRQAARRKSTKQNNQDSRDGIGGRPEVEADGGARVYIAATFSGQDGAETAALRRETQWAKAFPFSLAQKGGPTCPGDRLGGTWVPEDRRDEMEATSNFSAFHFRLVGGEGRGLGERDRQCSNGEGWGVLSVSSGPRNETIAVQVAGTSCHEAGVPKVPHPKR
jgi:hypothetical protein